MSQHPSQGPITTSVTEFFRAIETGAWPSAHALLADPVHVAHGSQWMTLSRDQLIAGWKDHHEAFSHTRYELGTLEVDLAGQDRATARCTSQITLHTPSPHGTRVEAIVGRYTINLQRPSGTWQIDSIRHDPLPNVAPSSIQPPSGR